jgi:anti-sigma factor RsiW
MDHCTDTAPLIAAWIDGALDAPSADRVAAHVAACAACATSAAEERAVRRLLADRRETLTAERAPAALRSRLEDMRPRPATPARRAWMRLPVAIAATLALAVSGVALHVATGRSTTVLAAQLAADHATCHLTGHVEHELEPAAASDRLATRYGLHTVVPPGTPDGRLRLVGARRCLTGSGRNAHIVYRYAGHYVSLFLLPDENRSAQAVEVLGERAEAWTRHNGTYVLVADAGVEGLQQVVDYMQQATR